MLIYKPAGSCVLKENLFRKFIKIYFICILSLLKIVLPIIIYIFLTENKITTKKYINPLSPFYVVYIP